MPLCFVFFVSRLLYLKMTGSDGLEGQITVASKKDHDMRSHNSPKHVNHCYQKT